MPGCKALPSGNNQSTQSKTGEKLGAQLEVVWGFFDSQNRQDSLRRDKDLVSGRRACSLSDIPGEPYSRSPMGHGKE